MTPARKAIISAFVALNLVTVAFINIPEPARRRIATWVQQCTSGVIWWRFEYAGWRLRSYAHAVGLDNRWVMFSSVYRSDWQLQIKAQYQNGSSRLLPLPLQGDRTFWQRHFGDFREAKFHLNIYADTRAKSAYANHLAREFARWDGALIDAVSLEVQERSLVPTPEEAEARGTHFAGERRSRLLAVYQVSEAGASK